jgi:hypothetical protein
VNGVWTSVIRPSDYLNINSIKPFPLLGVAHRLEIFLYFEDLLFFVGRNFKSIDCLEQVNFLIKCFFKGLFPLFFSEGLVALDFLEFSDSPHLSYLKNYLKFLVKNFEICLCFGISSSLNLFFVSLFFCLAKFALLLKLDLVLFDCLVFQFCGEFSCKPSSS